MPGREEKNRSASPPSSNRGYKKGRTEPSRRSDPLSAAEVLSSPSEQLVLAPLLRILPSRCRRRGKASLLTVVDGLPRSGRRP